MFKNIVMKKGLYLGLFDLFILGYLDVIECVFELVDVLYIVIVDNFKKKFFFIVEECVEMIKKFIVYIFNILISYIFDLVVRYVDKYSIKVFFRGFRNIVDYENEYMLY